MEKEDRFWLALWVSLAFFVTITILGCHYFHNEEMKIMTDKGYIETTLPGYSSTVWQKPE